MALYKTKGIVLQRRNFDETARIITFFTNDFGKISAIAKGSKRPNSKFGGRLEPLNLLDLSVAHGRNLDILSQCETIENFKFLRDDPHYLKTALYFARIIHKATDEKQKNLNLFKLIILSLGKLDLKEPIDRVVKYFEVNFLRVEGLFRRDAPPDILIGEHLNEDVRQWKI
ncbi:DNA repair protein RecO [Candidatus Saganbacteria bacterium]|nr:DNA repair protein RecO [Candidatus Saganbacteria bacterium]